MAVSLGPRGSCTYKGPERWHFRWEMRAEAASNFPQVWDSVMKATKSFAIFSILCKIKYALILFNVPLEIASWQQIVFTVVLQGAYKHGPPFCLNARGQKGLIELKIYWLGILWNKAYTLYMPWDWIAAFKWPSKSIGEVKERIGHNVTFDPEFAGGGDINP